jgi:hypothetical protein
LISVGEEFGWKWREGTRERLGWAAKGDWLERVSRYRDMAREDPAKLGRQQSKGAAKGSREEHRQDYALRPLRRTLIKT